MNKGAGGESANGAKGTIIGIDPGAVMGIAVHRPDRSATGHVLMSGASWECVLDPLLPAYVFIEQPVGDSFYGQRQIVASITGSLRPFDAARQLVPPNVWRYEVLKRGDANKQDAINYAIEHYPRYKLTGEGDGRGYSGDLAEALCIMEYGRRLVEGRLRRDKDGLVLPALDMRPPTRGSSSAPKYRLGIEADARYRPLPPMPWRTFKDVSPANGEYESLYKVARVWASGYTAAITHCQDGPQAFSAERWMIDAKVRKQALDVYIDVLVRAGLVYDGAGGVLTFRPADDPHDFNDKAWNGDSGYHKRWPYSALVGLLLDNRSARTVLRQWASGGDPALALSDWKLVEKRRRHDARWGAGQCDTCGTYALGPDELICQSCTDYEADGGDADADNEADDD